MGIASCVIAAIAVFSAVMMVVVVIAMSESNLTPASEQSPIYYVVGGWLFGTGVASLTGIVFGIGGLLQKERRRQCAVIGLIANVVIPIALMACLVAATTFQHAKPWDVHSPVEIDPNGWHSPSTQILAFLTVVIAIGLAVRVWKKRRVAPKQPTTIPCSTCRKLIPSTSLFCRRCGHPLQSIAF